jgi:hypothetical protein
VRCECILPLMLALESSRLWNAAFKKRREPRLRSDARERLKVSLLSFRGRAEQLVAQIPRDLRELTVHDISHLDALWQYAAVIVGPDFEINPVEGFVLGGAFLVHDAGMSLAAYPGGYEDLRKHPRWKDTLFVAQQEKLGRAPTAAEQGHPSAPVEQATLELLLRELHAEQAEKLAEMAWKGGNGQEYHLIEDTDLRNALGPIIGKIGFSHWWSISKVADELKTTLGAPLFFPSEWTIDSLKIACIMRLADAAHLDWRRAPGFLRALVKPAGVSADHWNFQEHLNQPVLDNERLVYTANKPFTISETKSWWLCYDSLRLVDLELRGVDALFVDRNFSRFGARAIKGVEDPLRLTQFVPTKDWDPVDARIMVSDVAGLVNRLGGEELYGDDPSVPLRELIQNASDAIRARRTLERRGEGWGEILISMGRDESGPWIEVCDNGIGMSERVLTGPFLDFGKQFWGSGLMLAELPGLAASGFESTGRYGIGFFSAFMWGDKIRVSTLRSGEAARGTRILEFDDGTASQPVLRRAKTGEQLGDGGTAIRVWLRKEPRKSGGLLWQRSSWGGGSEIRLATLVRLLCPAVDAQIVVQEGNKKLLISKPQQWLKAKGTSFFRRMEADPDATLAKLLTRNLRVLLLEDGSVAGRVCVVPHGRDSSGVIAVGGLRAGGLTGIAGILRGRSKRAARDIAEFIVPPAELARWATEQSRLVADVFKKPEELASCAGVIHLCGGDATALPLVRLGKSWLSASALAKLKNLPSELILVDQGDLQRVAPYVGNVQLNKNVLFTVFFYPASVYAREDDDFRLGPRRRVTILDDPIEELVSRSLSKAWGREVWVSRSEGVEVGDGAYCDAKVFRADDDS